MLFSDIFTHPPFLPTLLTHMHTSPPSQASAQLKSVNDYTNSHKRMLDSADKWAAYSKTVSKLPKDFSNPKRYALREGQLQVR